MPTENHDDYAEELLKTAELLSENGRNNLASRHRAVSTAYYAVFHTLQFFIARSLLGEDAKESTPAFEEIFRLLDHGVFKKDPFYFAATKDNDAIKKIFENCNILKAARIDADYRVPRQLKLSFEDATAKVFLARITVSLIRQISKDAIKMRLLTVNLLLKKRSP